MELLVRYKPTGDDWYEFDIESGILIKKQRNKPAVCTIDLPNTFATTKASSYANLQVLLNNQYLFDGHTENKGYGKDKHKLVAYDWLWDFTRQRRIMEQGTTAITPSEAFTDVFDNAGTSAYFNGIWYESYTGPWIDGYNATRHVVPAETSATYGDPFFDCIDQSGIWFMKYLADLCYVGDKYKYFYRYENIGGERYLFFEPDGWGTTHENPDYTVTQNLHESTADILNNIRVWGRKVAGYFPPDCDYWTEKDAEGWSGGGTFDTTWVDYGNQSLYVNSPANPWNYSRHFTSPDGEYVNMETLTTLYMRYYWTLVNTPVLTLYDSGLLMASVNLNAGLAAWHTLNITGKEVADGWTAVNANFDWTQVGRMDIHGLVGGTGWLDHLYFYVNPLSSENNSDTTGQDAASIATYGNRSPEPIHFNWINNRSDCNARANVLCKYYKDPQYKISMKWNDFMNFKLNDNINFTEYQKDITLPIDQLTWNFKTDDEIETSVSLGLQRMKLSDLLSKFSTDVKQHGKDWGQQYYVF